MIKQILILSLFITTGLYSQNKKEKKPATKIEKGQAPANSFKKGQLDINLGLGLLANRYYYGRGYRVSPPLNLSIDKGITENVSIGGYLAFVRSVYKVSDNYFYYDNNAWINATYEDTHKITYGVLGIRGAFHFAEYIDIENLDLYAGAMLGYSFAKYTYKTNNSNGRVNSYKTSGYGGLVAGFYVGGRYRFTEKFGVYGEFGYGLSYGNIGVNFKF